MRPPRLTNTLQSPVLTGIIGAESSKPPNSTISPTSLFGTGMIRTAVVLLLIMPIAASSAIMPAMVSALVLARELRVAEFPGQLEFFGARQNASDFVNRSNSDALVPEKSCAVCGKAKGNFKCSVTGFVEICSFAGSA